VTSVDRLYILLGSQWKKSFFRSVLCSLQIWAFLWFHLCARRFLLCWFSRRLDRYFCSVDFHVMISFLCASRLWYPAPMDFSFDAKFSCSCEWVHLAAWFLVCLWLDLSISCCCQAFFCVCFYSAWVGSRFKKISWIFRNSAKTGGIGPVRIPKLPNLLFIVSKFQKKR
jgi:hypothetical protein